MIRVTKLALVEARFAKDCLNDWLEKSVVLWGTILAPFCQEPTSAAAQLAANTKITAKKAPVIAVLNQPFRNILIICLVTL